MPYIHRYPEAAIAGDLEKKMVFIGGPRQTGKTTLGAHLAGIENRQSPWYLNWDSRADRENIIDETFPSGKGILLLDEIHKYARWRQTVKGLYDTRYPDCRILVTGSARLDYYRKGGDSLQGRYHYYRLLPLTMKELGSTTESTLGDLLTYGGFPEPFLAASERETRRWSMEYRSRVIEEDLNTLENVKDVSLLEQLAIRLPNLVGSPLSLNALREDLQVSHQSVERWIAMMERLYLLFRVYPFGAPTIRAVKKEAKHYHFDWTQVKEPGPRFENLLAVHLLKWCWFRKDAEGEDVELRYFRDTDRREVDFVIVEDGRPVLCVECKSNDTSVSASLRYFKQKFPAIDALQVVRDGARDFVNKDGIRVCPAVNFLGKLV